MNEDTTRKHSGHGCYKYMEADRGLRRADIVMVWIFVVLGVAALAVAVVYGAWHLLLSAAFYGVMAAMLCKEAKELRFKS